MPETRKIKIRGVEYATPANFMRRGSELWGYFLANDNSQYDEWLYWGEATDENLDAIAKAGVEVSDWEH